jgi:hypothetical protein
MILKIFSPQKFATLTQISEILAEKMLITLVLREKREICFFKNPRKYVIMYHNIDFCCFNSVPRSKCIHLETELIIELNFESCRRAGLPDFSWHT